MSDYISRSDLMAQVNKKKADPATKRYTEGFNDAIMRVRSMIHSAPDVGIVAKWLCLGLDAWRCSYCGEIIRTGRNFEKPTQKYCGECGAKMAVETEDKPDEC